MNKNIFKVALTGLVLSNISECRYHSRNRIVVEIRDSLAIMDYHYCSWQVSNYSIKAILGPYSNYLG